MPIWFELLFLLEVSYGLGFGIGWLVWGRPATSATDTGVT